jgi:putative ABC transport system substrate-binding protein
MKRRQFITLLGGAAAAWSPVARAQQRAAKQVIGYLSSQAPNLSGPPMRSFHQGLAEAGYIEGRNVAIEYRWADGHYDRLPELAADLVRRQVTVIATTSGIPSAAAAKAATATIPIVFSAGIDPVRAGLVASLNRPGGNVTGVASLSVEVGPKRLQLLHEAVPAATTFGLLVNPANPNAETLSRDLAAAGRALRLQMHVLRASADREFAGVFEMLMQVHAGALMIGNDPFFTGQSATFAALALRYKLPAIYQYRDFADAGGLMTYGPNLPAIVRQVGMYTGRVLKGEKPGDLPIQQITKLDLIFNLKTAKAFGLDIPATTLAIADEVIE